MDLIQSSELFGRINSFCIKDTNNDLNYQKQLWYEVCCDNGIKIMKRWKQS